MTRTGPESLDLNFKAAPVFLKNPAYPAHQIVSFVPNFQRDNFPSACQLKVIGEDRNWVGSRFKDYGLPARFEKSLYGVMSLDRSATGRLGCGWH
jgi:hypothetical protein